MGKSDYLENYIVNHVLGGPDYIRPGDLYIAAYTEAPSDAGGGTEVSGTGYARVNVPNDLGTWSPASGGQVTNLIDIIFPTAGNTWGTVSHVAIHEAATGDSTMLYWGSLSTPKFVDTGNKLKILAGTLVIGED